MPERSESGDKAQIGLTAQGDQHLQDVMATGWFEIPLDAYRVAIAVALANNVVASPDEVAGAENKYNFMGGVDRDGRVRSLIGALRPEYTSFPARYSERLAHAGLSILASKLREEDSLLSSALAAPGEANS